MSTRAKVAIILVLVAVIVGLIVVDGMRKGSSEPEIAEHHDEFTPTPDNTFNSSTKPADTGLSSKPSDTFGTPTDTGSVNPTIRSSQDTTVVTSGNGSSTDPMAKPIDPLTPKTQDPFANQNTTPANPLGNTQPNTTVNTGSQPMGETASRTHKVQKNDNFWDLAKHYYGDGSKFKLIEQANPGKNSSNLKIGDELVIPAAPSKFGDTSTTPVNTGMGSGDPATTSLPTTYEVKKGDNLTKISMKFYKKATPKTLEKIVSANHLKDANSLSVGDKLTIPSLESPTGN